MAGAKPGVHVVQLKRPQITEALITGNKFVKWDDESTLGVPVTLKVDPQGYVLYWKDQNKETDCLTICLIRDVRYGKYAKVPKEGKLFDSCQMGRPDEAMEDKTITISYGSDFVNTNFVNFVSNSKEIAKEWCDLLMKCSNNLLAGNSSVMSFLERTYTKISVLVNAEGKIPVKSFFKHFAQGKDDRKRIEKSLEFGNLPCGKNDALPTSAFTFKDFFTFYMNLTKRQEMDKIFAEIGAKKKPYYHITVEQFVDFLNNVQRDPRLNEVLYPYYDVKRAQQLINIYEHNKAIADKGQLSQEGLLRFLMSDENLIIDLEKLDLSEDMDQPLAHYFINSSHNTYLTGHQLTGKSSVEIYRQVLLSGCRCIELDCWDGKGADEEPVITHGFTMCTEVSFRDVIECIAESAFKTSDAPVILSFENHCSTKQQAKMAIHLRNILGDLLLTDPLDDVPIESGKPLPSPNQVKRKIIVKNKKKHHHKAKKSSKNDHVHEKVEKIVEPVTTPGEVISDSAPAADNDVIQSPPAEKAPAEPAPAPEPKKVLTVEELEKQVMEGEEGGDSDSDSESDDDEVTGLTEEEEKRRQQAKREQGTAGKEAEAGLEMSLLVNYVQPIHFHSFEIAESRNRSYEISSFVETQSMALLKEAPVDFVNYNKRQLSRIYPKGTRVDSSNYMPQVFWNAGCQMVALNFQTLDLAMQLNQGIFEYNGRCGYILKPDFMRRPDRHFDPFAESTVDGIVAGTVSVRIISGQFLTDKKVGTYVDIEMYGLPADTVRKKFKTKTIPGNGINPMWDEEPFVFKKVVLPNLAVLRMCVYEETGKLIGFRVLPIEAIRPGYRHIPIRNESNQPNGLATLFVHISVKDYVPDAFADFAAALANPIAYQSELEKHAQQLAVLTDDFEVSEENVPEVGKGPPPTGGGIQKRTNSVRSVQSSDSGGDTPAMSRQQSSSHVTASKQESVASVPGTPSTNLSRGMSVYKGQNTENGGPTQNILQASKLNEAELIAAVDLEDLKMNQKYQKLFKKMQKELDVIRKKQEKSIQKFFRDVNKQTLKEQQGGQMDKLQQAQQKIKAKLESAQSKALKKAQKNGNEAEVQSELDKEMSTLNRDHSKQLKELKKGHIEAYVQMCMDHFKAEVDLYSKYHEPLYECLEEVLDENFQMQLKRLETVHDKEVVEWKKKQDIVNRDEMKVLQKKHKEKNEFARIKREAQQKYISQAVQDRQKLRDLADKKKSELQKNQDESRKEFEQEKKLRLEQYKKDFDQKAQDLRDQYKDDLKEDDGNYSSDDE
ncbi:1-phosphatidylinositol 4,5-bisphosphate phosphodiesterase beta-1-like isoform X2 [Tubulanus polymorphus]|uniref:1-phosphatidylinositol 4,5-bisphosphate phosphodiesterase beta-1-like isoform X2 n=1 Tax=Tubulanus polymorphus TaxID=672921 RepID=UPI003DA6B05B